jgi:hypothetical protein
MIECRLEEEGAGEAGRASRREVEREREEERKRKRFIDNQEVTECR